MLSSLSSTFDKLPPRPPTPPREVSKAGNDAIAFLDDGNDLDRLLKNSRPRQKQSDTVVTSSPRPTAPNTANVGTEPKRVGFNLELVDIDSEISGQDSSPAVHSARRTSTGKNVKPVRSILKLTYPALPPTPDSLKSKVETFSPDIPGSFARMLQSIIQQLAGPSRISRLDAYLALNGVLKAYSGVPDVEAMVQRMNLFMQFLARDMSWKDSEGNYDINIITQALKLTSIILGTSTLTEALDSDFKACLVDRSIAVFEHPSVPKAVLKAHLIVAAQPRFHASLMSPGRADKFLTALKTIEGRCTGNSVVATRLVIYLRMIERCPSLMLTKMSDWIEHVFHGMLSSIKDIRIRAIEVCTEAGIVFGQQPAAARALNTVFLTEIEDGQTYFDFLLARLVELVADPETGPCVPQIWSAVVLFFRTKRASLSTWPKFKSWLIVLQKCLNSSNMTIRHQALLAWNKLVFAVMPDASTDRNLTSMLKVPIVQRLPKRAGEKHAQQSYQDALGSYCNLLHYALRPGLSEEDLDVAWELQLGPVLSELVKASGKGRQTACEILCGVFNGNTGVWNANAALEQPGLSPDELSRLDPRWVRSRLDRIIPGIEPILTTGMYSPADANIISDAAWSALMQSIADAGSQEVKTSQALKVALAHLINIFRRLWIGCKEAQLGATETRWLQRYVSLIQIMVDSLGASPFAEDILAVTKDDGVEVAPTPSQKHSRQAAQPQSPMMLLLQQFLHPPSGLEVDEQYTSAITTLLELLIKSKSTPTGRLALLNNCLQLLSPLTEPEWGTETKRLLWSSIARTTVVVLASDSLITAPEESQGTGQALRHASHVLAAGLAFATDDAACSDLENLYRSMQEAAATTAGDGGVVLAVAEPFSKALTSAGQSVTLDYKMRLACNVLEHVGWPKSRQSLDTARKSLWGVSLVPQRSALFDPIDNVYALINDLSTTAYQAFDTDAACNFATAHRFLLASLHFLDRTPLSLLGLALRKAQTGLSIWVRDENRKTGSNGEVSKLVCEMWTLVIRLLKKIPSKGSDFLKVTMDVMIAGMSSPHKAIVNDCILFWNNSLGKEESLEYPPALETVLRARAIDAEIILPAFPESNGDYDIASLPMFFESQSEPSPVKDALRFPENSSKELSSHSVTLASLRKTNPTDHRSPLRKLHNESSLARRASRKSASGTPKPRLRHDNSQIQFAPIETSPLPPVDDSQLLTEHQKEVKSRQHENAHIFQDFSSSPTAHSTALPRTLSKRLDFTSHVQPQGHDDGQVTPSGLADGTGLMSDDLPSSPTPSSGRDACQHPMVDDEEAEGDDVIGGPPSSPPQTSRVPASAVPDLDLEEEIVGPDDTTVDGTELAVDDNDAVSGGIGGQAEDVESATDVPVELGSDLPSDSILPTMQLQQEEEEASVRLSLNNSINVDQADVDMSEGGDPHQEEEPVQIQSDGGANDIDVTRIENSFVEPTQEETSQSDESQQSQRASKKRKRSSTSFWSSKKCKQQSPLKRLATYLLGQGQEEDDDDDIGDEIVVASSQRSSSPVPPTTAETAVVQASPPVEPSLNKVKEEETVEITPQPVKRSRGRPRKSDKVTTSQTETANTLKRKASTLSVTSVLDEQQNSQIAERAMTDSQSRRVTRKTATAMVVNSTNSRATDQQAESSIDAQEQDEVAPTRPIATARGILSRLHETLADIGGIILGSQEEREFDDILFAIRTGVHEAGRRGRQSTA